MEPDKKQTGQQFLGSKELAELLGVSQRTLINWRNNNLGPEWLQLGGSIKYAKKDVNEWLLKQKKK